MKINSGAVLSSLPDDAHVLAVDSGGGLRRLTPSGLRADIRADLGVSRIASLTLSGEEWVRVARTDYPNSTFCGILTVLHSWNAGKPVPLVCILSGSASNASGIGACRITSGAFFAPSSANNQGLSFLKARFVKEDDALYIEVQFKPGSNTPTLYYSLCGQINMSLVTASVSTVADTSAKVLKTIDLCSGGVMRCITVGYDSLCASWQKGGHHERGREDYRLPEVAPGGFLCFGSLDDVCEFIGRAVEDCPEKHSVGNVCGAGRRGEPRRGHRAGYILDRHSHRLVKIPAGRHMGGRDAGGLQEGHADISAADRLFRAYGGESPEFRCAGQPVGALEGVPVLIAGRKEVAYV